MVQRALRNVGSNVGCPPLGSNFDPPGAADHSGPERSLTAYEHLFDTGPVLAGRKDIVGDLARLRRRFLASADSDADDLLDELELLAATAVALGMSYSIVDKASGIPRERIEVVLEARPTFVERCTSDYQRHASGAISRRET